MGGTFVGIHKGMVVDEGMAEDGGFGVQVRIEIRSAETGLGPVDRRFETRPISQASGTAAGRDHLAMDVNDLIGMQEFQASFKRVKSFRSCRTF